MTPLHRRTRTIGMTALVGAAALAGLAACGGSSGSSQPTSENSSPSLPSGPSYPATSPSPAPVTGAEPGTKFGTAMVPGLGRVVVDARGRTVYVLTSDNKRNVPCTDASGCTGLWPDLPLPDGVTAAKAGPGIKAKLLGTKKSKDGETYPTYNGWLMYEYAGDSGPGQANGEDIQSFGGSWYALTPAGTLLEE